MSTQLAIGTPVERFTRMMFTNIIRSLARFLSQSDFTISQIAALHIVHQKESLSVQALSDELDLSISATSRLVQSLVKKGLLTRQEDPESRRTKAISCSSKGSK